MEKIESEGSDNTESTDTRVIAFNQEGTLAALSRGAILDARVSQKLPVDELVSFGLKRGFIQEALKSFPDPRKSVEVPMDVLLLPQVLQRLNNEHSLLLAPYMLNSADIITQLGYNIRVLKDGFNDRNVHKRQAPFHGETLKHVLLHLKPELMIHWFNTKMLPIWRSQIPSQSKTYILDGTKIEIPEKIWRNYQGAGKVQNDDGSYSYGYKVVWIQEVVPMSNGKKSRGILVGLYIGPIETHDLTLARMLTEGFPFEEGSTLICDRGFIDGAWITDLKVNRKVDVVIPLRRGMKIVTEAVIQAYHDNTWLPHPTRKHQQMREVKTEDLKNWSECAVLSSGVLVKWKRRDGLTEEVLFVTTKENQSGTEILATYDQRTQIEESHRQLKLFQGFSRLPSKKWTQVVFRLLMGVIGFNLMNLFLIHENCEDFDEFSLKTLRQKRRDDPNPEVIVYTETSFAVLKQYDFLSMILGAEEETRKRLPGVFQNLSRQTTWGLSPAPPGG